MNSTKVQNPQRINEPYIHWNPASRLIQNSEEPATEKAQQARCIIFQVTLNTPLGF